MKHLLILGAIALFLTGCARLDGMADRFGLKRAAPQPEAGAVEGADDPFLPAAAPVSDTVLAPATAAPRPPSAARTAEALDTTTPAQRAAAAVPSQAGGAVLGRTIVSLGSPTEPGLWLKTPLVQAEAQGRVTNPATGKSSLVTLIPLAGPPTAGSQMSLSALRVIDAPLAGLTEVEVALEQ